MLFFDWAIYYQGFEDHVKTQEMFSHNIKVKTKRCSVVPKLWLNMQRKVTKETYYKELYKNTFIAFRVLGCGQFFSVAYFYEHLHQ